MSTEGEQVLESAATLGTIAIVAGVLVIVVAFVPYVALSYRRHGRFSTGKALLTAAAVVYLMAVWAYTLLPLPNPATLVCAGTNLELFKFVDQLSEASQRSDGRIVSFISDPLVMQLVLNVLLFIPLGVLVRLLAHRGFVVATFVGIVLSTFIETIQLTGVGGLYRCAYRVFDVDDILTNTTGALIGSLLALALPRALRATIAPDETTPSGPRPVTRSRRMLAMICDLVGFSLISFAVSVAIQAYLLYVVDDRQAALDNTSAAPAGLLTALGLWLLVTLATGRTIGDLAVRLRYCGGRLPAILIRPLRFLGGIGGYGFLELLLPPDLVALPWIFAVVCLIATLSTRHGRGLPGLLTGTSPRDSHAPVRQDAQSAR